MKRAALACSLACLCACASGTGGEIIDLRIAARADPGDTARLDRFATETGWEVRLSEARLALSALYAFAPERDPSAVAWLSRAFAGTAYAHGGYDPATGLRVRAELLGVHALDLLDDRNQELDRVSAEAGPVDTVAVELAPASAELPAVMQGHTVYLAGVANRAGERIEFAGGLDLAADSERRIQGLGGGFELRDGGVLVLRVLPSQLLRYARFERLMPDSDAAAAIDDGGQVARALAIAIRSPASFTADFIAEENP